MKGRGNDPHDEGGPNHVMVLLSGLNSSERSFDDAHVLRCAALPDARVSVLSNRKLHGSSVDR